MNIPDQYRTPPVPLRTETSARPLKPPPVLNWHTASDSERGAVWAQLRPFVETMIVTYDIRPSEIAPCWWRHPSMVQELYALMMSHGFWFFNQDAGVGPLSWLERLGPARDRIRKIMADQACTPREHIPPDQRDVADITAATDAEWATVTSVPYHAPMRWPITEESNLEGDVHE